MFDKKKLNFWRLFLGFVGLVLITLMFLWSGPKEPKAQMMTGSMGDVMRAMHGKDITFYDFFVSADAIEDHQPAEDENHHEDASTAARTVNFLTTATVFLLLPFILGGAIALAIVWFK